MPALWLIGPLAILGCLFLFFNLPTAAMLVLPIWSVVGFLVYFGYSRSSHLGRGHLEVPEARNALLPRIPVRRPRKPVIKRRVVKARGGPATGPPFF